MKNREQFVEDWRHEIDGWILDAAMQNRSGAELSMFLRVMRTKIGVKLGSMYDDLSKPKGPTN
jgi:hypothetical protein